MSRLSRRQFMLSAGSAALVAGCGRLPGQVQQPTAKVPRVGYLSLAPLGQDGLVEAFRQGLQDLGYVEGQNILIDYRHAEGSADQLPELTAELVRLPVDVLVVRGAPVTVAAKNATSTIPIVSPVLRDPVGEGLVASLARPGGNLTGLTRFDADLSGKRLELLTAAVPKVSRVGVLWHQNDQSLAATYPVLEDAARKLGVQLQLLELRGPDDFEPAFEAATRDRADGLVTLSGALIVTHQARIVALAATHRLPTIYGEREAAEVGGLMAYGSSLPDQYRRAAYYVDRILKGTKPADLPIERPMRFEFVVNMKTARALGITFPHEVALQITEVIE